MHTLALAAVLAVAAPCDATAPIVTGQPAACDGYITSGHRLRAALVWQADAQACAAARATDAEACQVRVDELAARLAALEEEAAALRGIAAPTPPPLALHRTRWRRAGWVLSVAAGVALGVTAGALAAR